MISEWAVWAVILVLGEARINKKMRYDGATWPKAKSNPNPQGRNTPFRRGPLGDRESFSKDPFISFPWDASGEAVR